MGHEPVAETGPAAQALAYLADLARFGSRPGLERIAFLAQGLGEPQRAFRSIHVAGTNGKGSTAAAIAAALQAAGFRVGLYTSPHLVRFHERIRVNGQPISDEELAEGVERVRPLAERAAATPEVGRPTQFEVATAIAFDHFARQGVAWAVLETGLGGRWDATNLVVPELAVITPIGHDHMEVLGGSLAAIAGEKAGIIKADRPVVLAPQPPEALEVLLAQAEAVGAPVVRVVEGRGPGAFAYQVDDVELGRVRFRVATPWGSTHQLQLPLGGAHQALNGAVAAAAVLTLAARRGDPEGGQSVAWEREAVRWLEEGWRGLRWPGRFEIVPGRLILDGAHNPEGARALAQALAPCFGPGAGEGERPSLYLVFSCMEDKPVDAMLAALAPLAAGVVVTQTGQGRLPPLAPERIAAAARAHCSQIWTVADPVAALRQAHRVRGPRDWICLCGSLYLVGEVKARLASGERWFHGRSA